MEHLVIEFDGVLEFQEKLSSCIISRANSSKSLLFQLYTSVLDKEYLKEISNLIKSRFPLAEVIGCTTVGEIIKGEARENTSVISITSLISSTVKTLSMEVEPKSEFCVGEQLGKTIRTLSNEPIKAVILLATPLSIVCEKLLDGLNSQIGEIPIVGGGAGDQLIMRESLVLQSSNVYTNGAAIAIFYGNTLKVDIKNILGWVPFGQKMNVTKVNKNSILEIDNKPALDVYQRYIGNICPENIEDAISFPLIFDREGKHIARVPISIDENKGLGFIADVHCNETVRLGYGDINSILQEVRQNVAEVERFSPESIFLYSCCCRQTFLQHDVNLELRPFEHIAPTAGFFTLGEFSNQVSSTNVLNSELRWFN